MSSGVTECSDNAFREERTVLGATLRTAMVATLVTAVAGSSVPPPPSLSLGPEFANLVLAATPPAPVGTLCPASSACWNNAVEPQIRADGDGTFYVSTENGLFAGTIAAKSTDGGLHYASLSSPNATSKSGETGFAPGGGDTDVAVAPERNAGGSYTVYVASLTLAEVDVSTSFDGGATWRLNPTGAQVPGDDREWIAADGVRKVCISYHDLATFNVDVDCSYDAGRTFTQHAVPGAIDAAHAFLLQNNQIGNLTIDPSSHVLYQVLAGIANRTEISCGIAGTCGYRAVWIAVSTDGGRTFTDYPVVVGPRGMSYNHIFPNVAVDRAGAVYVLYSDDHSLFYSFSTDRGRTWSSPAQVNQAPVRTAIFPWAVAGDAGRLDVVYYGTAYRNGSMPPDDYPKSAVWYAYFAQNLNAMSPGSVFTQVRATPVVHLGGVCERGVSCAGNRDLFDDFGVAASPTTGLASIAYTTDQYAPSPRCTAARANTFACDHTAIATQNGGPGIFVRL